MRLPALGYRLRAGLRAYGTSNMTNVKLQNQDIKTNARHSESWRDRRQDEYVHSLRIRRRGGYTGARAREAVPGGYPARMG